MKTLLITIFGIFSTLIAFAQDAELAMLSNGRNLTDANIQGHVVDAGTGEHLPFISVVVKGTAIGISADASGHFFLKNLPVGDLTLEASSIGYKTVSKQVKTEQGKTIELNFELDESSTYLGEVVVSATRNETDKKEAPIIVNVVSQKVFEGTASCNLAESMNFQPGLRVENNCGNCGTTQLRINGLEGQYSQILLNSRPIFSSLAGVYGLEQLPVGMIERVEVVRGGGSALYGASAIGGVVNIITKEPLRNSLSLSNTTNILKGGRKDINTSLNGSFVSDDFRAGVHIFGMLKNRDWYDRNGDGFSEIPELNSETAGFRGYYKTSRNTRLNAEYHHIHEFRRGGNKFERPPHETDITEQLEHYIDGGGLDFEIFSPDYKRRLSLYASGQIIKRDSYYGAGHDATAYGHTEDNTIVAGTQYTHRFDKLFFMPAEFTAGLEFNFNDLDDKIERIQRTLKQVTRAFGGYVQNEWKNEKYSMLIGARLDKHNLVHDAVLSPRANLRYSPSDKLGLRASYSSGYRAPQAYDEDLHVEAVSEALSVIEIAKGLKPEYSHSISASADIYGSLGSVQMNFLAEGFYTMLKDVFALEARGKNDDETILYWERVNGPGATVKGLNFELKAGIPRKFEVQTGFTLQSSKYNDPHNWSDQLPAQRTMFRAPDYYGYLTSNINITRQFTASLFGNYTGSMLVKHVISDGDDEKHREKKTQAFWDMGIKLAYDIALSPGVNIQLNGGVKNIFDSYQKDIDYGPAKDAGYVYGPALPRMLFFGVKFTM